MRDFSPCLPSTRREFLRLSSAGIGLLAFSRFAPSFLVQSTFAAAPAPEKDRPILVLVQLAGGNDGLNTLIPFEDSHYYRLRPTLAIAHQSTLPITDQAGLHPACAPLQSLFKEGKLSVVQNVGYPNPNRSHFRSTDIWETGSDSDQVVPTGWIGRFLDNACAGSPETHDPLAVHVSNEVPQAFLAEHPHTSFGLSPNAGGRRNGNLGLLESLVKYPAADPNDNATFLKQTMMDALVTEKRVQTVLGQYRPDVTYPGNNFSQSLRNVAGLIAARVPTRVYFVSLSGFDTHANQAGNHQNLLKTLSDGLAAFQRDLEDHRLADQVITMTFSEFGRRPLENQSRGTDHGTAAPLFIMGSRIKSGVLGTPPNLDLRPNQDLTFTTDFRQVYATVLERWLNCPAEKVLGKAFTAVDFL